MTHEKNTVWQKRKSHLKGAMQEVKRTSRRQSRRRGLTTADRHLLDKLIEFLDTTFDFFYDGFDQETGKRTLGKKLGINFRSQAEKERYFERSNVPADTLYAELLRQTSLDFLRIQQAADQPDSVATKVADLLAQRALLPSQKARLMCHGQSYLNQTTYPASHVEVRLLPYSHGALIGFPVTAYANLEAESDDDLDLSMSFLTLAHECAHVIYRSGRLPETDYAASRPLAGELNHKLAIYLAKKQIDIVQSQWLFDWFEEIFCDAYGCFVEGPVFVAAFHDVMGADYPTDTHNHNDSEHPIPALRPLIISRILKSIVKRWSDDEAMHHSIDMIAQKLDAAWVESVVTDWSDWAAEVWPYGVPDLARDGIDAVSGATYQINGESKSGLAILDELQVVIDLIVGELFDLGVGTPLFMWETDLSGWDALEPAEVIVELHRKFVLATQNMLRNGLPEDPDGFDYPDLGLSQAPFPVSNSTFEVHGEGLDAVIETILTNGWSTEGPRFGPGGGSGFG